MNNSLRATKKHPRALFSLSLSYSLFMAAFGGILASLTLYQTNQLHMNSNLAYGVFSAAMALLWIFPLWGGYLSEKLGYTHTAYVGLLFCALGMGSFCFNDVSAMYIGLALFVVGNALATPAIWCMVDHCYSKDSLMRESGFTLFYLYFNLGAVISIFLGGYIATKYGFSVEFALDTVCLLFAMLFLHIAKDKILPQPGRTIAPNVSWGKVKIYMCLMLACVIATPLTLLLFKNLTVNNVLIAVLMLLMIVVLLKMAFKQPNKMMRNKFIAFVSLAVISITFWTLYSLEPSFLSVFIQNNVDTHFLGFNIPASSYFAFDGVFVILIGLVLSRLWVYLNLKRKNPTLSFKFAASLVIIGCGFAFLGVMTKLHGNTLLPTHYVVIAYAIFAFGELLVSPLGISMVGSLAPEGQEGLLMGFWQLSTGVGGMIAGYVAMIPHFPAKAEPLAQSNPEYVVMFVWVGGVAALLGFGVMLFTRKLYRLMEEPAYIAPQV